MECKRFTRWVVCARSSLLVTLLSSVLLVGCGGGVEGTGASFGGVNGDKFTGEIKTEEEQAICQEIRDEQQKRMMSTGPCQLSAIFFQARYLGVAPAKTPEEATTQCEQALETCKGNTPTSEEYLSWCTGDPEFNAEYNACILDYKPFRESCNIPVSVLGGCIMEELAPSYLEQEASHYTCADAFRLSIDINPEQLNGEGKRPIPDYASAFPNCQKWLDECTETPGSDRFGVNIGGFCNVLFDGQRQEIEDRYNPQ